MSSSTAMEKYAGGIAEYRYVTYKSFQMSSAFNVQHCSWKINLWCIFKFFLNARSSEGKTVEVPYRGDVKGTVLDMLGGLRSACTYVGASRLKELSRRTTFVRVTQQLNNIFKS